MNIMFLFPKKLTIVSSHTVLDSILTHYFHQNVGLHTYTIYYNLISKVMFAFTKELILKHNKITFLKTKTQPKLVHVLPRPL